MLYIRQMMKMSIAVNVITVQKMLIVQSFAEQNIGGKDIGERSTLKHRKEVRGDGKVY